MQISDLPHKITSLYKSFSGNEPQRIQILPQSGSDRIYFRIYDGSQTFIATANENIKENKTFIYFSNHFKEKGIPVPEILTVNDEHTIYLQQDAGKKSLLNVLEEKGYINEVLNLFHKTVKQLAHIQIKGNESLDYDYCLTAKHFGKQAIMSDLLYFKYYFLDALHLPYDKEALMLDFEKLSSSLSSAQHQYFMFRDFQSRNVIVNNNSIYFIDYQGGMKGALQYDLASLLWQAKAALPPEWKQQLMEAYIREAEALLNEKIDTVQFVYQYNGYVLIRLLQVLGAYGFRGFFQRKAHFLSSIPQALKNLQSFLSGNHSLSGYPMLHRVLNNIISPENISKFEPVKADADTPLVVKISSFSYKKGMPQDDSGNGGGFVFDCRGIYNPGRHEAYKFLCGKDKEVCDFLEQQTKMNDFLNSVFDLVDIAVEDYIKRGFTSLMVNFGCTGGQHRSVYAAEQLARHLRNKFNVKTELIHHNQHNWLKPSL